MTILFHNYSNGISTEPAYLASALQKCGINAQLWSDPRVSAFDVFDSVQPDVFITSFLTVTPDILKYLECSTRKIDLVLNVTGVSDAQMENIESVIDAKNLNVPLVFTNHFGHKKQPKTKLKCERIYPAFDLFAVRRGLNKPVCREIVLASSDSEFLQSEIAKKNVYHLAQVTNGEKEEAFDFRVNSPSIQGILGRYENCTLVGDADFCSSQLFFDTSFNSTSVSVSTDNRDDFDKFLSEVFVDSGNQEDISVQIKHQLKVRHTPFHRAGTLLKHLKMKDGLSQVEHVKGQLGDILKEL